MSVMTGRLWNRLNDETVLRLLDNMIWPILALVVVGILLTVPQTFRNIRSIEFILHGSVGLGFVTLAASICLIAGYFDLSVAAIAGFSAMLTALVIGSSGWNLVHSSAVGFVMVLSIGVMIGILNGFMISRLEVNPFLQTLAMLIVLDGGTVTLSQVTVTGLPALYTIPGDDSTISVVLLLLSFLAVGGLLKHTDTGQAIYALGSDESAARAVGIGTTRLTILVYALSGLFSAMGGLMLSGFVGVVSPTLGDSLLFPAFAGAIIGGISLFGGRGNITGALGGVMLLGLIQSSLNISGVQPEQIRLVNGLILFFAILVYNSRQDIRERVLAQEFTGGA